LYNDTRYLQHASDILLYCRKKFPNLTVRYQEAESLNPIDYNVVYPSMVSAVKGILKEEGTKDVEYTISLTSGTPTMHSCWILIVMGGIIDAKLIQSSREDGIQDVKLPLDDFLRLAQKRKPRSNSQKLIVRTRYSASSYWIATQI
jgi:sigma54-dependent transcription regulator